jgi:AraC-like DNA-binding protein
MGYREQPPPAGLAPWLACTWARAEERATVRVLPDGCTDLIARADGGLFVAGPDTRPRLSGDARRSGVVGVRFRPGAGAAVLGVPLHTLRDGRPELSDLWGDAGRRLTEELAAAPSDGERLRRLLAAVARRREALPDPLVAAAAAHLERIPRLRIGALARDLGLSERQLLRRFDDAVGYGPKVLARVLRLQRLLALPPDAGLAWAALAAGYADQAHMSAEVRRLAGLTPAALQAKHVRFPVDRLADAA